MKRTVVTTFVLTGALLAGGCATKKYVRQTTAPIQAKVDQVDQNANKNASDIQQTNGQVKQVDERAQQGISAAKERAMTADTHAQDALNKVAQVQQTTQQNTQENGNLQNTVANLDNYKLATETTIPFRFNRYNLTDEDKTELDKVADAASKSKRFYLTIEGFTDRTGSRAYNESLSQKRADAVAQYLVTKHDIPLYRIHMIGLGEEKPVEMGRTRAARAKNRRVEVRLFTSEVGSSVSQLQSPQANQQPQQ